MSDVKKIGRYEVIEELGRGAMGTVYRAKDPNMDRVVALKTIIAVALESAQGTEFRERFYREARAAGALAHPGIVPVFDMGEHEGTPYLVMEFVTGQTLAQIVKSRGRLSLDRVCAIGQSLAEALGHAHKRGVVHRDIKPANILLTSTEAYGIERPKITDFGVAKLAEGQTTMTGQMLGTPAFMPPEQFTGAPIDGRADIFSLGVVLYWLATGEQPFPGESMTAVSYKVVHTEPVPPRKLNPSISAKLESVILKCIAKSPEDRYQSGEELARELGELRGAYKGGATQPTATSLGACDDPDATIVGSSATTGFASHAMRPAAVVARGTVAGPAATHAAGEIKVGSKIGPGAMLGVVIACIVVGAGGWYALRRGAASNIQPGAPAAATAAVPTIAVIAPPVSVATSSAKTEAVAPGASDKGASSAKAVTGAKSVSAASASGAVVGAKTPDAPVKAAVPAAPPDPVALDFDPRGLDSKKNARLKIDDSQMPAGLGFTIEMNGKIYFRKAAGDASLSKADLFVPPGVQQFLVTAKSGAVEKTSNTVVNQFEGKKKNTLKIELRTAGMSTGVPQALYADTDIVLTLK